MSLNLKSQFLYVSIINLIFQSPVYLYLLTNQNFIATIFNLKFLDLSKLIIISSYEFGLYRFFI